MALGGQLGPQNHRAEALRARRDIVYAQHQVGWALDRLCEMDGARWVYDSDELGAICRDVMTILTHHAVSRQAAMAPTAVCCSPPARGEPREVRRHSAQLAPQGKGTRTLHGMRLRLRRTG